MNKTNFTIRWEELTYLKKKYDKNGSYDEAESFIKTWFYDAEKRVYDKYDFLPPPLVCHDYVYNMWKGYPVIYNNAEPLDCKEITDLIWVICGKNQECYDYFMNWLAQMVQYPAVKTGTAIVFKSKQGAGKGTIIQIMRRIMGDYATEVNDPQLNIFGTHGNAHIGKILVSLDEVENSDTCKILGKLKNIITSDKCQYNEKGLKMVEVNNMCRFIFTTNRPIPINLEQGDRRYCLIESCNDYCLKSDFWNDYYKNVVNNSGKIKTFYYILMVRDISGVDWMNFPDTEFKKDILRVSVHPIVFWFDYYIHNAVNSEFKVGVSELYDDYMAYCNGHNIRGCVNVSAFGLIFKNQIDFDKCEIAKVKSKGVMKLLVNRGKVFDWLKANDLTVYESLSPFDDDDGDEIEP
jgi:putative DNA primase/helicase